MRMQAGRRQTGTWANHSHSHALTFPGHTSQESMGGEKWMRSCQEASKCTPSASLCTTPSFGQGIHSLGETTHILVWERAHIFGARTAQESGMIAVDTPTSPDPLISRTGVHPQHLKLAKVACHAAACLLLQPTKWVLFFFSGTAVPRQSPHNQCSNCEGPRRTAAIYMKKQVKKLSEVPDGTRTKKPMASATFLACALAVSLIKAATLRCECVDD